VAARIPERITLLAEDPGLVLSREAFFARSGTTQRGRILEAVTHVVAARGYASATVSDIVATAGVSRTTFYEHFAGKKECLLESYRVATQIMLERITSAALASAGKGWHAALAAGIATYLETIRTEPEIARAQFVELPAIGADAVAARRLAQQRHAERIIEMTQGIRAVDPTTPDPDVQLVELILGGIEERVAQALQAGDSQRFDQIESLALGALEAIAALPRTSARPRRRRRR
jgi:AcrR family transcriptional regulator